MLLTPAIMDNEIEYLETRVIALIARLQKLEDDNSRFTQVLSQTLKENAELRFRVEKARSRMLSLIDCLPKDEEEHV